MFMSLDPRRAFRVRSCFGSRVRPCSRLPALLLAGAVTVAGLAVGCDDGKSAGGMGGAGGGAAALAPALAILGSNYTTTTSVSLYTPRSGALVDGCAKSGVSSATLTQPL